MLLTLTCRGEFWIVLIRHHADYNLLQDYVVSAYIYYLILTNIFERNFIFVFSWEMMRHQYLNADFSDNNNKFLSSFSFKKYVLNPVIGSENLTDRRTYDSYSILIHLKLIFCMV